MATLTKLFEPIQVGGLELRNRIKMPAMVLGSPDEPEETVIRRLTAFYGERGRGGVAIMGVSCTPTRLIQDPMLGLYDDRSVPGLRELAGAIRACGAAAYAQMGVGYSWAFGDGPVELVGPSGISVTGRPRTAFRMGGPLEPMMPRALSGDEIREMVKAYGDGARWAREAGFDAVEVIASVGYVIAQFLSPLTNTRTDEYGGSPENRMRLLLDIVAAMRKEAGVDFTYLCRLSGADLLQGGYTIEDTVRVARALEEAGVHQIDVMSGWHNARVPIIQTDVPQGAWADLAEAVKKSVGIPIAAGTQIQDVLVAERVLAEGKADMVYMARALLADPDLPNKAKEGRLADIRPCMNCCRCIEGSDRPPVFCSVNAGLGRELEYPAVAPATKRKHVLVVGGGPAGIEAARVVAARGHRVTLCERGSRLGGSLLPAAITNRRLGKVVKNLDRQLRALPVDVRLNTEATPDLADEIGPDVIILAAGGKPPALDVPGGSRVRSLDLDGIRGLLAPHVGRVAIVGGGFVGCQLAVTLVERGKDVSIIEESSRIGAGIGVVHRWDWMQRLRQAGARMETDVRVMEVTDEGVRIDRAGTTDFIAADAVIVAGGSQPNTGLAEMFAGKAPVVRSIGDCAESGKLLEATASGFIAGQEI